MTNNINELLISLGDLIRDSSKDLSNQVYNLISVANDLLSNSEDISDYLTEKFPNESVHKIRGLAGQYFTIFRNSDKLEQYKEISSIDELIELIKSKKEKKQFISKNKQIAYDRFEENKVNQLSDKFIKWMIESDINIDVAINFQLAFQQIEQKFKYSENLRQSIDYYMPDRQWKTISELYFITEAEAEILLKLIKRLSSVPRLTDQECNEEPEEFIEKFGEWELWMPLTMKDSIIISGLDPISHSTDTNWCTSKINGQNGFLLYVYSLNVKLFYIKNKEKYICIALDKYNNITYKGNKLRATVDQNNTPLSKNSIKNMLGSKFNPIISKIKQIAPENKAYKKTKELAITATQDEGTYNKLKKDIGDIQAKTLIADNINNQSKESVIIDAIDFDYEDVINFFDTNRKNLIPIITYIDNLFTALYKTEDEKMPYKQKKIIFDIAGKNNLLDYFNENKNKPILSHTVKVLIESEGIESVILCSKYLIDNEYKQLTFEIANNFQYTIKDLLLFKNFTVKIDLNDVIDAASSRQSLIKIRNELFKINSRKFSKYIQSLIENTLDRLAMY